MRLEKFTIKAQEALQAAQRRAESLDNAQLEPEHLLDALLIQEDGLVAPLLKKLGASTEFMRAELDRHLSAQPKVQGAQLSLSNRLDAVFRFQLLYKGLGAQRFLQDFALALHGGKVAQAELVEPVQAAQHVGG